MNDAAMGRITELIEKVKEAANSKKNKDKGKSKPFIAVGIEHPIGWVELFGYDIDLYFNDPYFYIEQTLLQNLWQFENIEDDTSIVPGINAWLGYYTEYTFFGMNVKYNKKGVPIIQEDHPLTNDPDLSLLKPVDFLSSGWMQRALKWNEEINRILKDRLFVGFIIWNRGCLDLAIQLRGYDNLMTDIVERPEFVHDLLKFITRERIRWWDSYYKYFNKDISPTQIGDDWLNIPFITPQFFDEFVLPCYLDMERYHGGIEYLHSCGNQTPIQKSLLKIKSLDTLEVSPWSDLTQSLHNIPEEKHLQINLHPNDVLYEDKKEIEKKLRFIADSCEGRKYSIATSGLTPNPKDNLGFAERIKIWTDIAKKVFDK